MFGFFTRPARRHRVVRSVAGPRLALEQLETRATPAAPVLSNVKALWSDPNHVTISGQVTDENVWSSIVHLGGAGQGGARVSSTGEFTVYATVATDAPISLTVVDSEQLTSSTEYLANNVSTGTDSVQSQNPILRDVRITNEGGIWHIRGRVQNGSPIGTIIKILSTIPSANGQISTVENPDGTFDIGIILPPGSAGGSISIIAINPDGSQSDAWDGKID